MKLNHPGLPKWPFIFQRKNNTYLVEGRHISYWRYRIARWLVNLAALAGFCFLAQHLYAEERHWQYATIELLCYFVGYAIFTLAVPLPRILCWLALRRQTLIWFAKAGIGVGSKYYKTGPDVTIQFRAVVDPRAEWASRGKKPWEAKYIQGFHVVEMLYGLRPIPLASIDSEYWAGQFAVALQHVYALTQAAPAHDEEALESAATANRLSE